MALLLGMARQKYTSAKTSRPQVPALHRALLRAVWKPRDTNADIGGGRFDFATEALRAARVTNIVYDPYNRSEAHNRRALERIKRGTTTVTVANVLNVIKERSARAEVIRLAAETAPNVYFSIYTGSGSGKGCETRGGWQENRSIFSYVKEIAPFFRQVGVERIAGCRFIVAC